MNIERVSFLLDSPAIGGGGEYLRQLSDGLPAWCESRVFFSSRGECTAGAVNAWRPDIIHVNHLRALAQLFGNPFRRPKAPVVFVVHGIHLRKYDFLPRTVGNRARRFLRLTLERFLYRKCAALVVLTETDCAEVLRLYGRDLNVVCIPNGAPAARPRTPSEPKFPADGFAFICVGRFDFQKGQDVLLGAIAKSAQELRSHGRRTLFIGGGKMLPELEAFADSHGIQDLVEFAGELPNAADYLACGRILVAPSRWEGLPFLLMEAGLQEKMVIASDCPGNHDLVQDGVSGRLFPVEDVDALARLLIQEWRPDTLQSFGDALYQHVQADYSREQMCARTLALWRSLKLQ